MVIVAAPAISPSTTFFNAIIAFCGTVPKVLSSCETLRV